MKIAIFENEYNLIDTIFNTVNDIFFNNKFQFDNFPSSQSLNPLTKIKDYKLVFIDIGLSENSLLDGYGLIEQINLLEIKPTIIILTGHSKVAETLKANGLPNYQILQKPVRISELKNLLSPFSS